MGFAHLLPRLCNFSIDVYVAREEHENNDDDKVEVEEEEEDQREGK